MTPVFLAGGLIPALIGGAFLMVVILVYAIGLVFILLAVVAVIVATANAIGYSHRSTRRGKSTDVDHEVDIGVRALARTGNETS